MSINRRDFLKMGAAGIVIGAFPDIAFASNELIPKNINDITRLYQEFKPTDYSKIFDNNEFGYAQIIVHRPLRLMVQFTAKKIASLRFVSNSTILREELKIGQNQKPTSGVRPSNLDRSNVCFSVLN